MFEFVDVFPEFFHVCREGVEDDVLPPFVILGEFCSVCYLIYLGLCG